MRSLKSWRGTPEEAREISATIPPWVQPQPLALIDFDLAEDRRELWENDTYRVVKNSYQTGNPFYDGPCERLDIRSIDGTPRHDWRDFQWIKNTLCGETWEALELYPSVERLQDPSNDFLLYCFQKIPLGIRGPAQVLSPQEAIAPQRGISPARVGSGE